MAFVALLVWAAGVFHPVPHHHLGWRQHVGGAALTGTLWQSGLGILGGALVVLVWLYLLSLALLLGAELNAVLVQRAEAGRLGPQRAETSPAQTTRLDR